MKDQCMSARSSDPQAERLQRLSNEVSRIAGQLASLSVDAEIDAPTIIDAPVDPDLVLSAIRSRRLRGHFFDADLFADPAWDMMLQLFYHELTQRRIAVSVLTAAAAVPATTALRWINKMVEDGICIRRADRLDGRRVFVELTPSASKALHQYFASLDATLVI
jgi:hypothetical protein